MIRRLLEQVPRLNASESIASVTRLQIGTGRMDEGSARSIARAWEMDAHGNQWPNVPPNQKGFVSAGMRVITVAKTPSSPTDGD